MLRYEKSDKRRKALNVFLRSHILSVREPQLRFVVRGTTGTFVKHGLDIQASQLEITPDPSEVFSKNFGREPESIWGEVQNIDKDGDVSKLP